jgi:hypothetical protein
MEVSVVFTYWTHDSGSMDRDAASALPMKAEWQAEFSDFKVYDDSAVLPLLTRWGDDVPELFRRIRMPSCKSDIARLALLLEFGGLYIDAHTGVGANAALSRLINRLTECEVVLFDLTNKHNGAGDISIANGAIYCRPRSPVVEMLLSTAIGNIRIQHAKELASTEYIPYNIAVLTGAWIITSRLFFLRYKPFHLLDEFSDRVKIWPLRGDADDPILFYRYYGYREPGMHWSERQKRERLFVLHPDHPRVTAEPSNHDGKVLTMPSSVTFGKPFTYFFVKELARQASPLPLRILDVGAGLATYPKMLKGALGDCRFTGIEVWSPYIEQFDLNYWYDELIIADVRYLDWNKVPRFDVAFFGDILEHMTRADAAATVQAAAGVGGCIVTSIPLGNHPQHAELGNPWERHISNNWVADELPKVFRDVVGNHMHSFIGVSVICSNPALRKATMDAYLFADNVVKSNMDKVERLDQFDYASLREVLNRIERG